MEVEINELEKRENERLNGFIKDGFLLGKHCPIEMLNAVHQRLEKFCWENPKEKERFQAIFLGFSISAKSRLRIRERELEDLKRKNKRTIFKKRKR